MSHPIEVFFSSHHPLAGRIKADFAGSSGTVVKVRLAAYDGLVQDAAAGTLHPAFATILLDSIMGGSVMGRLEKLVPIATVGLTVNHLRSPLAAEAIHGEAVCVSVHNDLAYVNGTLWDADGTPIAIASGTFMIGTRGTSIRSRDKGQDEGNGKESRI